MIANDFKTYYAENNIREEVSPKNIDAITSHREKNDDLFIVQCNEGLRTPEKESELERF